MSLSSLWQRLRESEVVLPTAIAIPTEQVSKTSVAAQPFTKQHYFTIRVDEMFLSNKRNWFSEIQPMVLTVSEFMYGGEWQTVPFIVGPQLAQKHLQKLPEGMLFQRTRVAGIHPYNGGRMVLTVVLNQMERSNYVEKFSSFLENTASVIDFSTALNSYVKIGKALAQGVESLLELGGSRPIIGQRLEIDPDAGDSFVPGYFALIHAPEGSFSISELWVVDNALHIGPSLQKAKPLRAFDYVLYSITQSDSRSDEAALPFHQTWQDILRYLHGMLSFNDKEWEYVRGKMFQLRSELLSSPDLTRQQAALLFNNYKNKVLEEKALLQDLSFSKSGASNESVDSPTLDSDIDELLSTLKL